MKTKKPHNTLRELFKSKLEYAEVSPDAALRSKIMRRVARQEFLHFNPGSFNVFYFGGILGTAITAGMLLLTGSNKTSTSDGKVIISDTATYKSVPLEHPVQKKTVNSNKSYKFIIQKSIEQISLKHDTLTSKVPVSGKRNVSMPTGIHNHFSKSGILAENVSDKKIVQSRFKSDAFLIEPSVSSGCAPLRVRFHNNSTDFDSCRWTFGDGGTSNKKDPEWIFDTEGEFKVDLEVYNHDGSLLSSSATVTVHPRPGAHFEISPEKAVIPNDEVRFLNYSTNAVSFKWDFGDGNTSEFFEPTHTYAKFSNYNIRLAVFSEWGCADSVSLQNAFSGSGYFIDFPNAFIPNEQGPSGGYFSSKSDEAAQVFHPSFSGVTDYQLKIFSKLGIPIFESNDISLGWDGYNKGQLCDPGVYIWKVRGKFRNGEPFVQMGDVTLLKN